MNLLEELKWRGLVYDVTNEEELSQLLEKEQVTLYCGFDPTADSLHVGSLLQIVNLMRFERAGHRPIALVGGGTGLIGDPSGKKNERTLNDLSTVKQWGELFKKIFQRFLDFDGGKSLLLNNLDWLSEMSAIELLRDYGKNFGINYMLAKDSVKSRLDAGLSFTEFTYMILQSIDFETMYRNNNCKLQIGGQDQWGNMTAGVELIRKVHGPEAKAFCITVPLVTKSDGSKFGKTETGTIWLTEDKTTPYEFYQFWINTPDDDTVKFLRQFTFLSKEEIDELEESIKTEPHLRKAQKRLAEELTKMVHSQEALEDAIRVSQALFSGDIKALSAKEIALGFNDVFKIEISEDVNLVDVLIDLKLASSKRESRQFIQSGAVSINGEKVDDLDFIVSRNNAIENQFTVIRRGKKKYSLIEHK